MEDLLQKIHERLTYDRNTGVLRNRVTRGSAKAGRLAGTVVPKGYRRVRIDKKLIFLHRIVWLLETGSLPPEGFFIDHRDTDPTNNHIDNLRLATREENARNTRAPATNTSGIKGVSWHARSGRWIAYLRNNRARVHIGYFADKADAEAAVMAARARQHGEFANHG